MTASTPAPSTSAPPSSGTPAPPPRSTWRSTTAVSPRPAPPPRSRCPPGSWLAAVSSSGRRGGRGSQTLLRASRLRRRRVRGRLEEPDRVPSRAQWRPGYPSPPPPAPPPSPPPPPPPGRPHQGPPPAPPAAQPRRWRSRSSTLTIPCPRCQWSWWRSPSPSRPSTALPR